MKPIVLAGLVLAGLVFWTLGCLAAPAHAESPPPGAVPFPVERTGKLRAKDGPVYYIDGPTVIPKNVEVTVQLDVEIIGINGASLDVQGGLKVHGTQDHWVKISHVDFSPTRSPSRGLHLDMVDLTDCRFVHAEDQGIRGTVVIENGAMQRDCVFDVAVIEGALKLMTIDAGVPWKIRCTPPDPKRPQIEIQIRSCWSRGLELSGPADITIRHSELKNGVICRGVSTVVIDGCDVTIGALAFHQAATDSFKGLTLSKCNLFEGSGLLFERPANPEGKKEKVKLDKFYFGPKEGGAPIVDKEALAALIEDGTDKPERNVVAVLGKPLKRKHVLVAYSQLRMRVPEIRK
jgi:hypothetical protein